jgi:hypothetical protein
MNERDIKVPVMLGGNRVTRRYVKRSQIALPGRFVLRATRSRDCTMDKLMSGGTAGRFFARVCFRWHWIATARYYGSISFYPLG